MHTTTAPTRGLLAGRSSRSWRVPVILVTVFMVQACPRPQVEDPEGCRAAEDCAELQCVCPDGAVVASRDCRDSSCAPASALCPAACQGHGPSASSTAPPSSAVPSSSTAGGAASSSPAVSSGSGSSSSPPATTAAATSVAATSAQGSSGLPVGSSRAPASGPRCGLQGDGCGGGVNCCQGSCVALRCAFGACSPDPLPGGCAPRGAPCARSDDCCRGACVGQQCGDPDAGVVDVDGSTLCPATPPPPAEPLCGLQGDGCGGGVACCQGSCLSLRCTTGASGPGTPAAGCAPQGQPCSRNTDCCRGACIGLACGGP